MTRARVGTGGVLLGTLQIAPQSKELFWYCIVDPAAGIVPVPVMYFEEAQELTMYYCESKNQFSQIDKYRDIHPLASSRVIRIFLINLLMRN